MSRKGKEQDNEVYILGTKEGGKGKLLKIILWIILGLLAAAVLVVAFIILGNRAPETTPDNPAQNQTPVAPVNRPAAGYIETTEETVNDVPLFLYTPRNTKMSLTVGMPDRTDSSLVFVAQAADVRADNQDIVGDFVLAGQQLARGTAKEGYCAVLDGNITIGVGEKIPLLQKAIDTKGYFFRQYALVNNGAVVENNPKNKSIRRALALCNNKVIMIESRSPESFHDFAQALADIGVSDAIYLVGSIAYGWYFDSTRQRHEFGIEQDNLPGNTSYIVWWTK